MTVARVICSGPGALRLLTGLESQNRIAVVDEIESRRRRFDARPCALARPEFKTGPVFGGFRGFDNPERFADADPATKADAFCTFLVDRPVFEEMDAHFQGLAFRAVAEPKTMHVDHGNVSRAYSSCIRSRIGSVTISHPMSTLSAQGFRMLSAGAIILVSRSRGATPEVMVLTGVALDALATAGTIFWQYFADEAQLAAMAFGDLARVSCGELGILAALTVDVRCTGCLGPVTATPSTPGTRRRWV
jgi:hypothetical protein